MTLVGVELAAPRWRVKHSTTEPLHSIHAFFSSADFFKINFCEKFFQKYHQSMCQTVLDPDQARHVVGPDLGPNCLQGLSADKRWQRLKKLGVGGYEMPLHFKKIRTFKNS